MPCAVIKKKKVIFLERQKTRGSFKGTLGPITFTFVPSCLLSASSEDFSIIRSCLFQDVHDAMI